jgi:hypothetical protein
MQLVLSVALFTSPYPVTVRLLIIIPLTYTMFS